MASKKDFKELRFVLTDDDTIAFNQHYILNSKFGSKLIWRQRLIFPLFLAIYIPIMLALKADPKVFKIGAIVLVLACIIVGVLAKTIVLRQQARTVRNASYSLDRIHARETVLKFNDEGIEAFYEGSNQTFDYIKVWKVSLTESGIYIWMDETTAMPVPASAFMKPGEMVSLFEFLKGKCLNAEFLDNFTK